MIKSLSPFSLTPLSYSTVSPFTLFNTTVGYALTLFSFASCFSSSLPSQFTNLTDTLLFDSLIFSTIGLALVQCGHQST